MISYTRGADDLSPATYQLNAQASDGQSTTTTSVLVLVPSKALRYSEAAYSATLPEDSEDAPALLTVAATGSNQDPISYTAVGVWPTQLSIDAASGVISYRRGQSGIAPDVYSLQVRVSDGQDSATVDVTITVTEVNGAPQFQESQYSAAMQSDSLDVAELLTVAAEDPDDDPLTYSAAGSWPEQITIDAGSGVISYTRSADGDIAADTYSLSAQASDGRLTATTAVSVIVAEAPGIAEPDNAEQPAIAVALTPSGLVTEGTEIGVTMTFTNLAFDSDRATTDYVFRADVRTSDNEEAGQCENQAGGYGLGVERYMYQVDEDPEVRPGAISASCPLGDYILEASLLSADNDHLASVSADFSIVEPAPPPPEPEPLSADATLSGLALSGITLAFDPATTQYTGEVGNDVAETSNPHLERRRRDLRDQARRRGGRRRGNPVGRGRQRHHHRGHRRGRRDHPDLYGCRKPQRGSAGTLGRRHA